MTTAETLLPLAPAWQTALLDIGRRLPDIWATEGLSQPQRKALLRCVIDKVVIHRVRREAVQTRLVWPGGATTTVDVPVRVGACAALRAAADMAQQILQLLAAGHSAEAIATQLTHQGDRSPTRLDVLPSTVQTIRLNHGLRQTRHQSPPRRIAGMLPVPQLARALAVSPQGVYYLLKRGLIASPRDTTTGLSRLPACSETLQTVQPLRAERLKPTPKKCWAYAPRARVWLWRTRFHAMDA